MDECESVLTGGSVVRPRTPDDVAREFGALGGFALQMLGFVCARTERLGRAAELLRCSLKLNPFLWNSYVSLCNQGEKPDPQRVFRPPKDDCLGPALGVTLYSHLGITNPSTSVSQQTPVVSTEPLQTQKTNTPQNQTSQTNLGTPQNNQVTPIMSNNLIPLGTQCLASLNTPTSPPATINVSYQGSGGEEFKDLSTPVAPTVDLQASKKKKMQQINAPTRRAFSGMSVLSPLTPSFGVLPLDSSMTGSSPSLVYLVGSETPIGGNNNNNPGNNRRVGLRRGDATNTGSNNGQGSVIGGLVLAPHCPPHPNHFHSPSTGVGGQANVRRSSRLFGNNNNSSSVKENNKQRLECFYY